MTGKDILDQAANIIRRQDLDRTQLLFFINTVRRAVLRGSKIKRFYRYVTNVSMTSGVIDITASLIKSARVVEYDDGTTKARLKQVYSYQEAIDLYSNLTNTGTPTGFLLLGTSMYILPVPTTGQVNIYGEFWPADLADSAGSSDITTVELPEAWVYMGAAEYFDMLAETDKAQYWQQKGSQIVAAYIAQFNAQEMDTVDLWKRRPFGIPRKRRAPYNTADLDDGSY